MSFQNTRHVLHQINTSLCLLKWNSYEEGSDKHKFCHEIEHLEELIGKMTDLVDQSKITNKSKSVELNKILQQTYSVFQNKAFQHQIECTIDPSCKIEKTIIDPFYLKELLRILVDNAIVHTPKGNKIKLRLHKNKTQTCISIQNEGVSISPEVSFAVSQGEDQIPNRSKSHGLGLCLARDIATQLNLEFLCKTKKDKYTRFSINFPQKP